MTMTATRALRRMWAWLLARAFKSAATTAAGCESECGAGEGVCVCMGACVCRLLVHL